MIIRQANPADYAAIHSAVKAAFDSAERADGNEQDLVDRLRESEAYIPQLSLVAEDSGKIVGHILFTRVDIGGSPQLALAPLSVIPAYQRRGIGGALITRGHELAGGLGYGYSVVLGSGRYYPHFGYQPAARYGIKPPFDVPGENFMACRLREDAPDISGVVRYAKAFGLD